MIASLSALPTVFSIGLQRQLAYRWNYLLRALFSAMPLLVSWVFWGAVFEGKSTVGSYTLASLLTYYAVLLIVESVSSPADDDFQISREIREGTLNSILLRPLPYGLYRAALFLSGRCAYLVAAAIPVLLCFFLLSRIVPLELSSIDLARGIPAILGSALLQFSLTLCLSLTSFWLLDISALIFLVYSLEFLILTACRAGLWVVRFPSPAPFGSYLIRNPRFFGFDGLQGRPLGGSIPFTRSIHYVRASYQFGRAVALSKRALMLCLVTYINFSSGFLLPCFFINPSQKPHREVFSLEQRGIWRYFGRAVGLWLA